MAMKSTVDRQMSLIELAGALDVSFEEVLADLEKLLALKGSGKRAGAEELGVLPKELLSLLHNLLQDLSEKDLKASSCELETRDIGRVFRKAFKATRKELMRTRDMLDNVYGKEQASMLLLGVPKQIPRDLVDGLLRMCRNTLQQLRDPDVKVTMYPDVKKSYPKGKETFVTLLEGKYDVLRKLSKRYVRLQARLRGLKVKRRQAMEEYNRCFPDVAKVFECLYRLSGRSKLAEDFQPSGQDRGLLLRLAKLGRAIKKGIKQSQEKKRPAKSKKGRKAKRGKKSA